MDLAMIQSTISGLKTAGDLAKAFLDLKSLSEVQGKVIELQSAILSAQSSALSANADQAQMLSEINALKSDIEKIKDWETQKQRYQLTLILSGTGHAYALKKSLSNGEPPHWICTKCYEDGKRMILQPRQSKEGFCCIACPTCKSELQTRNYGIAPAEYAEG